MKPILLFLLTFRLLLSSFSLSIQTQYTSIFSFGDSFTDTGNFAIIAGPTTPGLLITKPPYGMTFFGHPTGRISDGRLAIDFIAEALGFPLLPPSMAANQSFKQGANFAVAGATALDRAFFVNDGDTAVTPYNISVGDQLGWFDAMKPSLCDFVVGEFETARRRRQDGGGVGADTDGVRDGEPRALRGQERRGLRAGDGVPQGPEPAVKGAQPAAPSGAGAASGHAPRRVRLIYANFYAPIVDFATSPDRYGFNGTDGALNACCGGGGRYNFNLTAACGMPGVSAWSDPSAYVNWDGIHLTEAANRRVADGWLSGPTLTRPSSTPHGCLFLSFGMDRCVF
ncbi:unnamed protein product [Miscanthus lutarioriparius]|uniref:GDSL esterase/lipase n=1 Tax=Miscanthus lutarioriparius TaxID=422564 RepID=A0A811PGT6_9POAL|nr:unnamed protein product [Miscanthus lutarioriparius]